MTSYSAAKLLPEGQSVIGSQRTSIIGTRKKEPIKSPIKTVQTFTVNGLRKEFSDAINKVCYSHEQIALTRRGKVVAVLIPPDHISAPSDAEQISSGTARDNISEVLNRIHYKGEVLSIRRRDKVLAIMMSPARFNQVVVDTDDTSGSVPWEEVDSQMSSLHGTLSSSKRVMRKPRQSLP